MSDTRRRYLPAAAHQWLLPFYDPFVRLLGADRARTSLIEQAALRRGQRVLDIGCGTGTLVIEIERQHPDVDVVGLDPDPQALARARRKAERAHVSIDFDQGFADDLPDADASFDRVSRPSCSIISSPTRGRRCCGRSGDGRILGLMQRAGFRDAKETARGTLSFTRIAYYEALAPASLANGPAHARGPR